ncbi:MAG: winged helix DNA-binding protein [Hyphomonadaceae bacterium]|nr:winged helix DNA-binding protein [Hyphomonadaceae bacterium]
MLNAKVRETGSEEVVEQSFLKALSLLEQAHRRLHDVVKDNLERSGERSLTGVQALLLYEIGDTETPASALRARGSFAGTSMSYNVKKLQEGGYLLQSRSSDDRRTVRLKLTPSGKAVRARVQDLFEKQASALEPTASVRADDLEQLNKALARLERFWSDQIRYQL